MDRINGAGHVGRRFVTEDADLGRPPTLITDAWLNSVQEEIVNVILAAGGTLDGVQEDQLLKAINTLTQKASAVSAAASGTVDAITANFTPAIAALSDHLLLIVRAGGANTSTTPTFTPASATIAAKTIVKGHNQALVAGDISGAGFRAELQYDVTLEKWVLLNPATGVSAASVASVQGLFKNLQLSAGGLAASVSVSYDELVLGDGAGGYVVEHNVAGAITTTVTGAGGLDTGALAASTWYSIWRIGKTDGTRANLFSLSPTAPTMPGGYTLKARIGWFKTDGTANKFPLAFKQYGCRVQYVVAAATNVAALPTMASGVVGNPSTPAWSAVAVGAFVPVTASEIILAVFAQGNAALAPNNAYGGTSTATNAPPWEWVPPATQSKAEIVRFLLESQNIYAATSDANARVNCFGWEDNI